MPPIGISQSCHSRSSADQKIVGVPVITAGELDDLFSSRESPGRPNRPHHRLSTAADEANLLDRRKGADHLLRKKTLALGRRPEGGPVTGRRLDRLQNLWMGV